MIDGLAVWIGPEAVVLTAATPLSVLSSAVWGGGLVSARAIVNLLPRRRSEAARAAGTITS